MTRRTVGRTRHAWRPCKNFALFLLFAMMSLLTGMASAQSLTVNSTGDSPDANPGDGTCQTASTGGASCTLRAAIQEANALTGPQNISFNIGGTPANGVRTISPATELPPVTGTVTIDGYTQPGAARNTAATSTNAVLRVQIEGRGGVNTGLSVQASNSIVRGLAIYGFRGAAVEIIPQRFETSFQASPDIQRVSISGCFLGVRADGSAIAVGANGSGVNILSRGNDFGDRTPRSFASFCVVGSDNYDQTSGREARNLIANCSNGVSILGGDRHKIVNSLIGTGASGSPGPNTANGLGVYVGESPIPVIGQSDAGNVIAGNAGDGITIGSAFGPVALAPSIQANAIRDNGNNGVSLLSANNAQILDNVITGNQRYGVFVTSFQSSVGGERTPSVGNRITSNQIFNNGESNIRLFQEGTSGRPTENDPQDADTGPNTLQNFPLLAFDRFGEGGTLTGRLNSSPNSIFLVEVYASGSVGRDGRGQGQTLLRTFQVETNAQGNATFASPVPTLARGQALSATATALVLGNTSAQDTPQGTSEFGPPISTGATLPDSTNKIVFAARLSAGTRPRLFLTDGAGSTFTNVTTNSFAEDSQPALSPDDSKVLFRRDGGIFLINAGPEGDQNPAVRLATGSNPTWHPSGTLFGFVRDGRFFAQPIAAGSTATDTGLGFFSQNGAPVFSPNGRFVAYVANRGQSPSINIHIADFNPTTRLGSNERAVTNNPVTETHPAWSPDGRFLAFGYNINDLALIQVFDAQGNFTSEGGSSPGSNRIVFLTNQPDDNFFARKDDNPTWSRDGQNIAFQSSRETGVQSRTQLYVIQARPESALNQATRITDITPTGLSQDPAYAQSRVRTNSISISKRAFTPSSADGSVVAPGQEITYVLRYENDTNNTLSNVEIVDGLPVGTRIRATRFSDENGNRVDPPAGGNGDPITATNTGRFRIPSLAPGASGFVTVVTQVNTATAANTVLTNGPFNITNGRGFKLTVNAGAPTSDDRIVVGNTVTTRVIQPLTVSKTANKSSVNAGDEITYTLTFRNSTSASVTEATLTDTLPANVTAVSAPNGRISTNRRTITFDLGTLAANATGTRTLVARVSSEAASPVVNNVEFRAKDSGGATLQAGAQTSTPIVFVPFPNLRITKRVASPANNAAVLPNGVITYVITVTNPSRSGNPPTATARNLEITDTLPDNTIYENGYLGTPNAPVTGAPVDVRGRVIAFRIGDLPVNETKSATLLVRVQPGVPSGTVIRNASYEVFELGGLARANGSPVETSVFRGVSGEIVNNSGRALRNVRVLALNEVSREVAVTTISGPIAIGARASYSLGLRGTGTYVVTAFDNDKTAFREAAQRVNVSENASATLTFNADAPDTVAPNQPFINDPRNGEVRPSLSETNGSAVDDRAATPAGRSGISLVLLALTKFQGDETFPSQIYNLRDRKFDTVREADRLTITAQIAALDPELLAKYGFVASPNAGSAGIGPIAAWRESVPELEPGRYLLAALALDKARNNAQQASIFTIGRARFTISKAAELPNGASVRPGDTVSYLIRARNEGNAPATRTRVSDELPANTTFVSAQALNPQTLQPITGGEQPTSSGRFVTYGAGTVNANAQVALRVRLRVNPDLPRSQDEIENLALIVSDGLTAVQAKATTPVQFRPPLPGNLGVVVLGPSSASAGEQVTYRVSYFNSGELGLANVKIRVVTKLRNDTRTETYDLGTVSGGTRGERTFTRTANAFDGAPRTRVITAFFSVNGGSETRCNTTPTVIYPSQAARAAFFRMKPKGSGSLFNTNTGTIRGQKASVAQLQIASAFIGNGEDAKPGGLIFPGKNKGQISKLESDMRLIGAGSIGVGITGLDTVTLVNGVTISPTSQTEVMVSGPANSVIRGQGSSGTLTQIGDGVTYVGDANGVLIGLGYRLQNGDLDLRGSLTARQILDNVGTGSDFDVAAFFSRTRNVRLPLGRLVTGTPRNGVASLLISADGRSLVRPDGTALSLTRSTLIGADGASIVAAGGMNLIGADGGTLIGADGGTIVAAGGGNLIGADGATLIGADGGTIVAAGGGNLVGNNGNTLVGNNGNTLIGADGGTLGQIVGGNIVAAGGGNVLSNHGGQ